MKHISKKLLHTKNNRDTNTLKSFINIYKVEEDQKPLPMTRDSQDIISDFCDSPIGDKEHILKI